MNNKYGCVIIITLLALSSISLYSQSYPITNGTVNACTGIFTDSNPNGNYSDNENFEYTICSNGGGGSSHVQLILNLVDLGTGEELCFYDGMDSSAPLLNCHSNINFNNIPAGAAVQATAANTSGCLTIVFSSDGSGNAVGFDFTINCIGQCQSVFSELVSTTPAVSPADTGWIDICMGDIIDFNAQGVYPQNNLIYAQSDNTSSFEWDFGDGTTGFSPSTSHQYNEPGGYMVQLTITDQNGCKSTNLINQRIRVSGPPIFDIAAIQNQVCVGDTINITTGIESSNADINISGGEGSFQNGGVVAETTFLPDGSGASYQTSITLNDFSPGQTLTNVNDLLGICVNMEHSYMGDLDITITCPSGQSITLHDYSAGGSTFLGEPIDDDSNLNFGIGYDYCWTSDATSTWAQASGSVSTLPAGDYAPQQSLADLVGCSLNGEWTITIIDNLFSDNGVIFSWSIELNDAIYPNLETFELDIVDLTWSSDPSILINSTDSLLASPQFPGEIAYVLNATDNFGCLYDTTVNVVVLPQTDPLCYNCTGNLTPIPDVTICDDGETTILSTALEGVELTETTFQNAPNASFTNSVNPPSNSLESVINVAGLPYNTIDANSIQSICLNIDHTNLIDVVTYLRAPNGTLLELTSNNGLTGDNYTQTCFSPVATNSVTTGTAPFSGDWLPEGDFNNLIGAPSNGAWTLLVSDQYPGFESGVLLNWSITFSLENDLTWSWNPTPGLSCTNCPNPTASPTTTTTYDVIATDAYGCTFTEDVTVTVIDCSVVCLMTATLDTSTDETCPNNNDGSATITTSNAVGSVTYVLNQTTNQIDNGSFTGLTTGNYQVIATDANGCSATVDFSISAPPSISLDITSTDPLCLGSSDGTASVTAIGGTGNFSYLWEGNQQNATAINLSAGVYTVTVTDDNNCTATTSITLTDPIGMSSFDVIGHVSCNGDSNGYAGIVVQNGEFPFTYEWSTNDVAISNISSYGTWDMEISNCISYFSTGATGNFIDTICVVAEDNGVEFNSYIIVSVSPNNNCISNNNDTDGDGLCDAIDPDINDPCSPYSFDINNNGTCDALEPNVINTIYLEIPSQSNGTACLTLPASFDPATTNLRYCYDGDDANLIDNLSVGTYTVTVTDISGCSLSSEMIITEPDVITLATTTTDVNCFGGNDGTATLTASGGTTPFTYLWNDANNQTTDIINNLSAGTYTVTVTDNNSCTSTTSITITEPNSPIGITSITQTLTSCNGANNSEATVIANGGTGNYTYNWSNSSSSNIAISLSPTDYTVTVTDENGCSITATISINEYPVMSTNLIGNDISCFGGNDGSISVEFISGGAWSGNLSDYTYNWAGSPQNTSTINNLSLGTYTVTITDNGGCSATASTTIGQPAELVASINNGNLSCNDSADGFATASAIGGIPPYTYQWDINAGNAITETVSNLAPGGYGVIVTDASGCTANAYTYINPVQPLEISFIESHNQCNGDTLGSVIANIEGGTAPYSYAWSAGISFDSLNTNLAAGTYTVTVTDVNGCTNEASTIITEPTALVFDVETTDVNCFGQQNGMIEIFASGGTYPYTYSLDTIFGGASGFGNLAPGIYNVSVQDQNGCLTIQDSIIIEEPNPLMVNIIPDTSDINITLGDSLQLGLNYLNAVGDVNIAWNGLYGSDSISCLDCPNPWINDYESNIYSVTVTDENGCMGEDEIRVHVPRDREIFVPSGFTPNGDEMNDALMVHGPTGTTVLTFRVYDRWGELVFRADNYKINSTDSSVVWDGIFKGSPMNPAVFVWYVEVEYIDGRTESKKGNTTLIR